MTQNDNQRENLNIEELYLYREDVIRCLKRELQLLDDIDSLDLLNTVEYLPDDESNRPKLLTKDIVAEKKEILRNEIEKLENFDVVLSVVGTMKSGKSTTINAIVGRDIMPNRNRPMTALPTQIIHTPGQHEPILRFKNEAANAFIEELREHLNANPQWKEHQALKENQEMQALMQKIEKGWQAASFHKGEEAIFSFLADLNDLVRLTEILRRMSEAPNLAFPYGSYSNISELPAIEVEFYHLSDAENKEGRLILLDTPGPNEAGQVKLRRMLEEQLQRSSAVLLILDYTQLNSEAEEQVRQQIAAIPAINKNRLFALVNKFDQTDRNSDDADTIRKLIFSDLLKDKINFEHIYPISAQKAYLANRMHSELTHSQHKPDFHLGWVQDFNKHAFGEIDKDEWDNDEEMSLDDIRRRCARILKKSNLQSPIESAIRQTQAQAPFIAIQTALTKIQSTLNDIHNFCEINLVVSKNSTDKQIDEIKERIATSREYIESIENIQKNSGNLLNSRRDSSIEKIETEIEDIKEMFLGTIEEIIGDHIKTHRDKLEERKMTKTKYLTKIESEKGLQEWNQEITILNHMIEKLNKKEALIASSEEELKEMIESLDNKQKELVKKFIERAEKIIAKNQEIVISEINDFKKDCNNLFKRVSEIFKKGDFNLNLEAPNFKNFEPINLNISILDLNPEMRNESFNVKSLSWFWSLVSVITFDKYGKDKFNQDFLFVSKDSIQERIEYNFLKIFKEIESQIKSSYEDYSDDFINKQIGSIKLITEKLINEVVDAIERFKDEAIDKENLLKKINRVQIINNTLQNDIKIITEAFDIGE